MRKVIVVLGVMLLASSVASAVFVDSVQWNGQRPVGSSAGDVLWSQLDNPVGTFTDQAFEAAYAAYDAEAADDFVVDDALGWALEGLFVPGQVSLAGANPFFMNNAFYADGGGLPGAVLAGCDFIGNTNFSSAGDGDIDVDVTGCTIPPQTAWYSSQVRLDFNPFGQQWTLTESVMNGAEGVWRNPGNGFGNNCPDWAPMNSVCGGTGADFSFELTGTIPEPPQDGTPAVGPFGAVLLIASLGAGSAYVLRRRRA